MNNNSFLLVGDGASRTLFEAAARNDCKFIMKHMFQRTYLNITDSNNESCLHKAARYNSYEFICYSIKLGANLDIQNKDGETPLFIACKHRYKKIVELLLYNGAKPNIENYYGLIPIHIAASRGDVEIVKKLNSYGAKVFYPDNIGMKPIHYAARSGNVQMIKTFSSFGASLYDCDYRGNTLLHYASIKGNDEMILYLLRNTFIGDIKNNQEETSFFSVSKIATEEIIDKYLQYGFNYNIMNKEGISLLENLENNNNEIYCYLFNKITSREGKEFKQNFPLHYMAMNHSLHLNNELISSENVNMLDKYGRSILYYVIVNDDVNSYENVKRFNPNLYEIDSYKNSSLATAIICGSKKIIDYLIKDIKDINFLTFNKNFLYYAIIKNDDETALKLINKNIDIDYVDEKGKTLYSYALDYKANKIINLLVNEGNK